MFIYLFIYYLFIYLINLFIYYHRSYKNNILIKIDQKYTNKLLVIRLAYLLRIWKIVTGS